MIIMDIRVDNLYAFKNFQMNMSYPKKIVDSTIEGEYLPRRTNFRYKKVNIIMGANATGKTSLGKILMCFANYFQDGTRERFFKIIDDRDKDASLKIDFVTDEDRLYRFLLHIKATTEDRYTEEDVQISIRYTDISKRDNYETCAERLDKGEGSEISYDKVETSGWTFLYPQDARKNKIYRSIEDDDRYICILEQILRTFDPSIREVVKVQEVDNTYAIKFANQAVIIKDGQIANPEVLSSGTKSGLDISYVIASLICDIHDLYYCDELFPYVHSELEKACLSIIIDKITERKQLFFTTHNTDILDMQLPKHAFTFMKKDVDDIETPIKCINASQVLKRNTDSLKHAVENDLFCAVPDVEKIFEIAKL